MKPPEEMSYNELNELGLIHWYKDRNYRIKLFYKEGRRSQKSYKEMIKLCSETFHLSEDRIAVLVCSRRQRKPKTTIDDCLQCGTKVETPKKRYCAKCAKERIRESQRRHKVKSLKKDKKTNFIIQ